MINEEQPLRRLPMGLESWLSEDSHIIAFTNEPTQIKYPISLNINIILKLYSEFNQYKNN